MAMARETAERLEKVIGQIEGLYEEVSLLSKKSPNDMLNDFKVGLINKALVGADDILGEEYTPIDGFSQFLEDSPPSSSDAVFVISQYRNELERLRSDNIRSFAGHWFFVIEGEDKDSPNKIKTAPPRKILRK